MERLWILLAMSFLLGGCGLPVVGAITGLPGDDDDLAAANDDDLAAANDDDLAANDDDTGGDDDSLDDEDDPWGNDTDPEDRYHPEDYAGASVHGPDTVFQTEDCAECHGDDLTGGDSEVSCDPCHQEEWRTDCTYCHGGEVDDSGAPPRDIDGESDPLAITFAAHTEHGSGTRHAALACSECHEQPTDVLSTGHLLDDTPEVSEVTFAAGLASEAVYDAQSGCSSVYCHGNGQTDSGLVEDDGVALACSDCHPDTTSGSDAWNGMSGEHRKHLADSMVCADCHGNVVDPTLTIVQPNLHVDGGIDLLFSDTNISMGGDTCTGLCHWKLHFFESW